MGLKFNQKQKRGWAILSSRNKTRILFDGGSRSGKTALIAEYLVRRALQYPYSRQLAARKCRAHAKTSLWCDTLKKYLVRFIPPEFYTLSESELSIRFKNGSEILVAGLDDAERSEKVLGNEFITVFLNEATQFSWETVQMAATRLAQKAWDAKGRQAVPKLILDCNPRGPRHWLHAVGVRQIDPESGKELNDKANWARLPWSAFDNRDNLPKEYLEGLAALPEIMKKRMLDGIWCDNAGAVYQEFSEEKHVVAPFPIPDDWRRLRAIDFGYTNPFVCLWGAVDPDGRLYIYREWYKNATRTAEHARMIRELSGTERYVITVADHDAAERAELESLGNRTTAAEKNVISGIQRVKCRLAQAGDGRPRLYFFDNLKNILSEMYDYRWAPEGSSNAKEEPLKLNDHAMDALRYMIAALDGKQAQKQLKAVSMQEHARWS
ncbi:MAG: phage terminase large subunit [Lentisphaeria bacterium]|nr:phage terminase large subunit [Lentisphaeria bacterium]